MRQLRALDTHASGPSVTFGEVCDLIVNTEHATKTMGNEIKDAEEFYQKGGMKSVFSCGGNL